MIKYKCKFFVGGRKMNLRSRENIIIMTDFDSFNIEEILECGQCFRFERIDKMKYKIIAFGKRLFIEQNDTEVIFYPCTEEEFENVWMNYFDLNTDYNSIKAIISSDDTVKKAIKFAPGIRLLNQEPWECLISFIISQNNRIPQIKKVIANISKKYGTEIGDGDYAFPTIEQLKNATMEELSDCRTGFRNKYIIDTVGKISKKIIELDKFGECDTAECRKRLMQCKGVGQKVADCVLLFSLKRREVFPTDVWVKRVMSHFYFDENEASIKDIHAKSDEIWGDAAGYAQQYLFYYARTLNIK